MKATVLIRPKEGILDPQGQAVGEVDTDDPDEALAALDRMSHELLANPLIESFSIEIGGEA